VPYVAMDNEQIAALALSHLRDRGIRNFAVCGRAGTRNSALIERCDHFRALVEQDGGVCYIFPPLANRRTAMSWEQEQDQLAAWIRSLPKPVGTIPVIRSAFVDRHGRGPQSLRALRTVLEEARRRGYATEDGDVTPGFASVAVAVLDHNGTPLGGIATTYDAHENVDLDALVEAVSTTAAIVSRRLGRPLT